MVSILELQLLAIVVFLIALSLLLILRKERSRPRTQRTSSPGAIQVSVNSGVGDFRLRYPAKFRADDGHYVRSKAELIIDNWLFQHRLAHEYEKEVPKEMMTCDFYLPDHEVYIEFWGGATPDYEKRKTEKLSTYQRLRLKVVSLSDQDIEHVERNMKKQLKRFGVEV